MALTAEQIEKLKIGDWVKYQQDPRQIAQLSKGELNNVIVMLTHSQQWIDSPEDDLTLLP